MNMADFWCGLFLFVLMGILCFHLVDAMDREADIRREQVAKHLSKWDSERSK